MGLNFYAKRIPTKEQWEEIQEYVTTKNIVELEKIISSIKQNWHIGKLSLGNQFLWCPHIKTQKGFYNTGQVVSPWEDSLKSIKEFLSQEDIVIYDEYNRIYSYNEFFDTISSKIYHNSETARNSYDMEDSLSANYEYITSEGLRFSRYEDFC